MGTTFRGESDFNLNLKLIKARQQAVAKFDLPTGVLRLWWGD